MVRALQVAEVGPPGGTPAATAHKGQAGRGFSERVVMRPDMLAQGVTNSLGDFNPREKKKAEGGGPGARAGW